ATGANKPGTPGRSRISRNTIAQGRPVVVAEPVVLPPAFFVAGGPWVRPAPRLPCALRPRRDANMQSSCENAPRERMLTPTPLSCPRMRGIQYSRDGGYLSRRRGVLDRP